MIPFLLTIGLAAASFDADPDDPRSRLGVAAELAADSARAEEARDVLVSLWDDPTVSADARRLMARIAVTNPGRAGWLEQYESLANSGQFVTELATLRLRAAEARRDIRGAERRGLAELRRLWKQYPGRRDIGEALARAVLEEGGSTEAITILRTITDDGTNALRVFAWTAAGRPNEARAAAAGAAIPDVVRAAVDGDTTARVRAAFALDMPRLGHLLAQRADGGRANVALWRAVGEGFLAANDPWSAAPALAGAVRRNPQDDGLRRAWVVALIRMGDLDAARAAAAGRASLTGLVEAQQLAALGGEGVARAWALGPDLPDVAVAEARRLSAAGRGAEAMMTIDALLARDPVYGPALDAVFDVAKTPDDVKLAMARLQKAATLAGGPRSRDFFARQMQARYLTAAGVLQRAGRLDEALDLVEVAGAMAPDRADVRRVAGGALWEADRTAEAREAYLDALRLDPYSPDAFEAVLTLDIEGGQPALALERINARPLDRPRVAALERLARASVALIDHRKALAAGRSADAKAHLQAALDAAGNDPKVLSRVAEALSGVGRFADALSVWEKARNAGDRSQERLVGEAGALVALNRLDDAQARLDALVNPTKKVAESARPVRASLLRARGDAEKDPERALSWYTRAMEEYPQAWTAAAIGDRYLDAGRVDAALKLYEQALDLDPDLLAAHRGRLRALARLDRVHEAAQRFDAVTRADVRDALVDLTAEARIEQELRHIETTLDQGRVERARAMLVGLHESRPQSVTLARWGAARAVKDGEPRVGLQIATALLEWDPTDTGALGAAQSAAWAADELDTLMSTLEAIPVDRRTDAIRAVLDEVDVGEAVREIVSRRGLLAANETTVALERLEAEVAGNRVKTAIVAGGWVTVGRAEHAEELYRTALTADPSWRPGYEGLARAIAAQRGRVAGAVWLREHARAFNLDIPDSTITALLTPGEQPVEVAPARGSSARIRSAGFSSARSSFGGPPAFPLYLPEIPTTDGGPRHASDDPALSARAGGGIIQRSGVEGVDYLSAAFGLAQVEDVAIGPIDIRVDGLVVDLDDGVERRLGGALASGAAVRGRWGSAELMVGSTPLGMEVDPALTLWADAALNLSESVTVGADGGRIAMNDSTLAWVGDASGEYGRALRQYGGGWIDVTAGRVEVGARGRFGAIVGEGFEPVPRSEVYGWGNVHFGAERARGRVAITASNIANARQIDSFEPGSAGAFTPRAHRSFGIGLHGNWDVGGGLGACAGAAGTYDLVEGEPTAWLGTGSNFGITGRAALEQELGGALLLRAAGTVTSVGENYLQTGAMLTLGWNPWRLATGGIAPLHGDALRGAEGCR